MATREAANPSAFNGDPATLPLRLTVQQAAHVLGVKPSTVYDMIRQQQVPHIKASTHRIMISRDALLEWMGAPPVRVEGGVAGLGTGPMRDALLVATLLKLSEVEASLKSLRAMLEQIQEPSSVERPK